MIAWDDNIWGDEWVTFPHVRPPIGVKPSRNLEVRIGQRRYIENLKQRRHRPEDLNTGEIQWNFVITHLGYYVQSFTDPQKARYAKILLYMATPIFRPSLRLCGTTL